MGLNALRAGTHFGPFRSIFSPGSPLLLQKFIQPIDHDAGAFGFRIGDEVGIFRSRILSERYRYPRDRYAVKIRNVTGFLNIAAGF